MVKNIFFRFLLLLLLFFLNTTNIQQTSKSQLETSGKRCGRWHGREIDDPRTIRRLYFKRVEWGRIPDRSHRECDRERNAKDELLVTVLRCCRQPLRRVFLVVVVEEMRVKYNVRLRRRLLSRMIVHDAFYGRSFKENLSLFLRMTNKVSRSFHLTIDEVEWILERFTDICQ